MKKNVFVAYDRNIGKDEFDLLHTFDKEEAIRYAKYHRETQSSYDRKHSEHFVIGYAIECADGETAEAAYNRVVLEDELTDEDQVFYTDINKELTGFQSYVNLMDDEIREAVHADMAPCTDEEFLNEYQRRHLAKYGKELEI